MCLLAIKFPIFMRKIIGTMRKFATIKFLDNGCSCDPRKIATNTFLDTGCLMLLVYCFLFG